MEFQRLTTDVMERLRPFFRYAPWRTCDFTVGGMFMWRDYYHMEYCIEKDALYVRQTEEETGRTVYNVPLAPDADAAVSHLVHALSGKENTVRFCTVPEAFVLTLLSHGEKVEVTEQRDLADYLYTANAMQTFSGRHLAGQRNHMKHFARDHRDIHFEKITAENIADAGTFFKEVYLENTPHAGFEREENRMTMEVLENYDTYDFLGGILYAEDCVAGFSFGEIVNDTLFVHIEKSRRDCDGCYQTLTNQFAMAYCTEHTAFVNREEDMGDEGLRYAKSAYHPERLLAKYTVEIAL